MSDQPNAPTPARPADPPPPPPPAAAAGNLMAPSPTTLPAAAPYVPPEPILPEGIMPWLLHKVVPLVGMSWGGIEATLLDRGRRALVAAVMSLANVDDPSSVHKSRPLKPVE